MSYHPRPVPTDPSALPGALLPYLEQIAEKVHDTWAAHRLAEGWTHGPTLDHAGKQHPDLVPFDHLSESEKEVDRGTVVTTLRALLDLGFRIERGS